LEEILRLSYYIYSPGQTLIRKAPLLAERGFDETIWGVDDFDLWLRLARRTIILSGGRNALYYRKHPSNASGNILLMCLNGQQSIQKHSRFVPRGSRHGAMTAAARTLYTYRGHRIIRDWKRSILSGKWGNHWRYMRAIAWFLRWGLSDPHFFAKISRELLPHRLAGEAPDPL